MSDKYDSKYWKAELSRARSKRDRFLAEAEESCKVYSGEKMLDDCERRLSVWWYCVETLLPAYCSRVPKTEVQLRKRVGSPLYQLGAVAIERFTQYGLDEFFDFIQFGTSAARSFLLTGQVVAWARYEADLGSKDFRYALTRGKDGKLVRADGAEAGGEYEVESEEGDIVNVRENIPVKNGERAILDLLHYKDYCEQVGRNESEIGWRSRRAYLAREEATKKFGKQVADKLKYDTLPDDVKKNADWRLEEGKAEVEEIWCRETGKVYYLSGQAESDVLERGDPPIDFPDFWPCAILSASATPESTIPISDYTEAKDQILEIERLTTRCHAMTLAVRANFAYDKTIGSEVESLFEGDLKGVAVPNWPSYKGRGGLASAIEGLPIERFVQCLQILTQTRDAALLRLYESLKASDIVRGTTNAGETATAQQLKSNWTSLSFVVRQNGFIGFISKAIEKLGVIMLSKFESETLRAMADGDALLAEAQLPPEQWDSFLSGLKKEPLRSYRIQIAADSLVAIDEAADRQSRIDVVQAYGTLLSQLTPMIEQYPMIAPYAMQLQEFVLRGYKAGKDIEQPTKATLQAVIQAAQAKASAQQQAPPVPGVIEAQSRLQIAQLNQQTDTAKLQLEQYKAQLDAQIESSKLSLEQARLQFEQAKASSELQLKTKEIDATVAQIVTDSQLKQTELALTQQIKQLEASIELQKADTQKYLAQLDGYEKLLEERRLASEDRVRAIKDAAPTLPAINIQVDAKQPGKRKGKIVRDAAGGAALEIEDVP